MKKLFVLFFVLAMGNAVAQLPGYMGKRFLLSANISPNLILPFGGGDFGYSDGVQLSKFKVRPRFGGSVDYTLSRNITLGLKYSYVGVGIKQAVYYEDNDWWGSSDIKWDETAKASIKCHSIGVRITKYASGNLPAPLGFFVGYHFGVGLSQFYDPKGKFVTPFGKYTKGTYLTNVHPDIILFVGIRRGIGKKMMWSFLSEFNFSSIGYWLGNLNWEDNHPISSIKGTDEAGKYQYRSNKFAARAGYFNANFFNVTLEFTFLPF